MTVRTKEALQHVKVVEPDFPKFLGKILRFGEELNTLTCLDVMEINPSILKEVFLHLRSL